MADAHAQTAAAESDSLGGARSSRGRQIFVSDGQRLLEAQAAALRREMGRLDTKAVLLKHPEETQQAQQPQQVQMPSSDECGADCRGRYSKGQPARKPHPQLQSQQPSRRRPADRARLSLRYMGWEWESVTTDRTGIITGPHHVV